MNQNSTGNIPPTMEEEAQRILSEVHNNEHKENMRLFSLIHNGLLLLFTTIIACAFGNPWLLLLLLLWDFEHMKQKKAKKGPFVSLRERWGK